MNSSFNPYASTSVMDAPLETRTEFVRKTYWHLAGAIAAFAVLESFLLSVIPARSVFAMLDSVPYSWALVLLAFMGVSSLAGRLAASRSSVGTQYAGLGLYILAESLIFLPIMMVAIRMEDHVIGKAAVVTAGTVLGLTCIAFTTRKDFTFLGGFLKVACLIALCLILAAIFVPTLLGPVGGLGLWFCIAMVVIASGCILYQTSQIMYHYAPGQHVAASLALFASVATLFWYILRLFMRRN